MIRIVENIEKLRLTPQKSDEVRRKLDAGL